MGGLGMERDDWRDVLFVAIILLTVVDVLFSPWLIFVDMALAAIALVLIARGRRRRIRAGLATGKTE